MEDLKEKREMVKPILVKMGVALGLTFAGFICSHFRQRRILPRLPPPPPRSPGSRRPGMKEGTHLMSPSSPAAEKEKTTQEPQKVVENAVIGFSPTNTISADAEGFILPEFNDLIQKDFNSTGFSPTIKEMESAAPKRSDEEVSMMEQEINNLRNVVQVLQERERNLEIQLLEYYGLQEQDGAVRELQNRLKISSMETQLFTIKIESLQAENRRLEAQIADYSRVVSELDLAKVKIKQMKRKIRSESEQAKEQLSALHQRVAALKEQELKLAQSDSDNRKKVERIKELETELAEQRKANSRLEEENSELASRLESAQSVIFSIPSSPQAQALEEAEHLRKTNKELEKELERLKTDRCADVEELVYLRWVNACLRYELRNYQPPPGKTVARDLSSTLSPRSEAKAKQLILEYANSGANEHENHHSLIDFDLDFYSPPQASTAGDYDDSSIDPSYSMSHSNSAKGKFLSKLKKMVLGKDDHSHSPRISTADKPRSASDRRQSFSVTSLDDLLRSYSTDSTSSCITAENAGSNRLSSDLRAFHDSSISKGLQSKTEEHQHDKLIRYQNNARHSLDIHGLRNLSIDEMKEKSRDEERMSDEVPSPSGHKRKVLGGSGKMEYRHQDYHQLDHDRSTHKQQDLLVKFAHALKSSHSNNRARLRSAPAAYF